MRLVSLLSECLRGRQVGSSLSAHMLHGAIGSLALPLSEVTNGGGLLAGERAMNELAGTGTSERRSGLVHYV